jgi:periplasmic divalent cation tolerance protein
MSDFIEIHWTSGSLDEARKVSRYLVQEKLVACAQIIPWIESIYVWNAQIETSQESKIALKTRRENYDKIKKIIEDNCTYEVPEITFSTIDGGNENYLHWLENCLAK